MSRIIVACGAIIDASLGGLSFMGGMNESWSTPMVGVIGIVAPMALFAGKLLAEAQEQPLVLRLPD
jgi:hypothetical protein